MRQAFLRSFAKVEKLASASRLGRCMHAPSRYIYAMFCRYIRLPLTKQTHIKEVRTFFNRNMIIGLPSGTDIYLTGGKTDGAELRLTRFLLLNITEQTHFIDIGAHFGYYSLLAEACCAQTVTAVEPSSQSFGILERNATGSSIITAGIALSDQPGQLILSEFPGAFAEYNTVYPDQFAGQKWFTGTGRTQTKTEATTLDLVFPQTTKDPVIVKIDAEGSEYDILKGAQQFLQHHPQAVIVMEYIGDGRDNNRHRLAADLLARSGFTCHSIQPSGELIACLYIETYMRVSGISTDNLVFRKIP